MPSGLQLSEGMVKQPREALGHPASIRSQQENNWSDHIYPWPVQLRRNLGFSLRKKGIVSALLTFLAAQWRRINEEDYELCCVQQVLPLIAPLEWEVREKCRCMLPILGLWPLLSQETQTFGEQHLLGMWTNRSQLFRRDKMLCIDHK